VRASILIVDQSSRDSVIIHGWRRAPTKFIQGIGQRSGDETSLAALGPRQRTRGRRLDARRAGRRSAFGRLLSML